MIQPETFYTATCDSCGEVWSDTSTGMVALNEEDAMRTQLEDDLWHLPGNGKTYCPDCHEIDDDDNVKVKEVKNEQL